MQTTHKCKRYDGNDPSCRDCALNDLEPLNSCYLPEENSNQVNHPTHYKQEGRRECIEEMRIMFGDDAVYKWAVMTAYKYRYRAGNKDAVYKWAVMTAYKYRYRAGNKADNSAEQDHAKAE